ncbi:MAG TPA: DUF3570 domain-containing protein [Candidatus Eisenbacteria bacterium]|nr:DUF3570 domain-containing protein [Candidatus Eisenbacteria bacterium]
MQLTRPLRAATLALAAGLVACASASADVLSDEPTARSLFRYFTDSDQVSVRSLMGDYAMLVRGNSSFSVHFNNERVRIPAISAPVGSQAAVDAITTASRPISGNAFQDFVKVRNEFQGAVSNGGRALEYYLSSESDYLGQQLTARYDRDFQDQVLNVAVAGSYGWDDIKPLADSDTNTGDRSKTTAHWNVIATRVLGPSTVLRGGVEYNIVHGLQHNPYRNVYAGGTNVAERHPGARQRRDLFLKLHQYLNNRSSFKVNYRLYGDDWGILSHEIGTDVSQYITQGVIVRYDYRYYTQTSADFYLPEYPTVLGIDGYLTGDYRMGPLTSHLFGVALNLDLAHLAPESAWLRRMGVWVNYERYFNHNNYSANILETALDFRF